MLEEKWKSDLLLPAVLVVNEGCCVDADDADEGSKVEKLGSLLVAEEEGAGESDDTDDVSSGLTAPDYADDRVQDVIHQHGPANDVSGLWMEFFGDVAEGGAGARVDTSHAAVADGREQHGEHGNEDGCGDVPVGDVADHTVDAHGGGGQDDDDSVDDEVPQLQGPFEARRLGQASADLLHCFSQSMFVASSFVVHEGENLGQS